MQEYNYLTISSIVIPITFIAYFMVSSYRRMRNKNHIKDNRHDITGEYDAMVFALINGTNDVDNVVLNDRDYLNRALKASKYYDRQTSNQMDLVYSMAYRYVNDMIYDGNGNPYKSKEEMFRVLKNQYYRLQTLKGGL